MTQNKSEKLLYSISSLVELSESLISDTDFANNAKAILHQILGTMLVPRGVLLTYNKENSSLECLASKGINNDCPPEKISKAELSALQNTDEFLFFDKEISSNNKLAGLIKGYRKLFPDINLWCSLSVKDTFVGALILGRKFMDAEMTEEDRDFLRIISRNVGVAIYNYQLISNLSQNLIELGKSEAELKKRKLEMEILYDVGLEVTFLSESVDEISEKILDNAVSILDARAGILVLFDNDIKKIVTQKNVNTDIMFPKLINDTEPLIKFVLENKASVIRSAGDSESSFMKNSEILATPILYKNKILGMFLLLDKESRNDVSSFIEDEKKVLAAFANQAAVAIENSRLYQASIEIQRMQREIELAAEIQRELIPSKSPEIEGYDIHGICNPCRTVGGDFFKYFMLPDGKLFIILTDVSGKGVPAALLVSSINSVLYTLVNVEYSLEKVAKSLSKSIYHSSTPGKYATGFLVELDTKTNNIKYINAGHNFPIFLSKEQGEPELSTGGFCIGMFDDAEYQSAVFNFKTDDILVIYTDGIIEQADETGEFFGEKRLINMIKSNKNLSARTLSEKIIDEVDQFRKDVPVSDDITLVIIKRPSTPVPPV
ncbi:MAG: SpoIIE family protein phosphatase [Acidobacteria bacterium]|nr:SpoIIE family protein phosphatase [Acidobacteriota bacterium]